MSKWPLVGRDIELARVREAIASPAGGGVVLVGPAGVGKTRLLTETVDAERAAARRVACVTATHSSRPIPLGAVADWIPERPDREPADAIAVLTEAFDGFARNATDTPLLVVDDAHLLDPLTATLLHRLALNRSVALLLAQRSGEPAPDAITSTWKDGLLERVELPPLRRTDVRLLIERRLGGDVEERTTRRLIDLAGGSVLFLHELVEGAIANGTLRIRDGLWHAPAGATPTPNVLELIGARLRGLTSDVRTVCELVALVEPLPTSVLVDLTSPEAVEEAERQRLVVADDGSVVSLAHPLYGETLRAELPSATARRLRGRLADALADVPPTDDVMVLRRTVLKLDSDTRPPGPELLTAAGIASALFDYGLAERLGRAALSAGCGFPARLATAYAVTRQGEPGVEGVLADLVDAAGTDEEVAAAIGLRASVLFWTAGRLPEARSSLAAGRRRIAGPARLPLDALHACFEFFDGRPSSARDDAQAVIRAEGVDPSSIAWASAASAMSHAVMGRSDEALQDVDRGRRAAGELRNERFVHLPLGNGEMLALGLAGRVEEARDRAEDLQALARSAPISDTAAIADFFAGQAALWSGELPVAVSRLREALLRFADYDPGEWSDQCRIWLSQALAMSGRPGEAQRCRDGVVGDFAAFEPLIAVSDAWIAAGRGTIAAAVRAAHRAASLARAREQLAVEVMALQAAVRWGDGSPAARLVELSAVCDGPRVLQAADHAVALQRSDLPALSRASEGWAEIGAVAIAADASAQVAAMYQRRGEPALAIGATRRARRLSSPIGLRTPALTALAARRTPLTSRELEVSIMAAQGRSNAEIAEALVVSVRTVEGHLQQVYVKLGIHSRQDLRHVLETAEAPDGH